MEATEVVVWIGVIVFAATSVLTLVYLAGFAPKLKEQYGKYLFRILIVEIVGICITVISHGLLNNTDIENRIPIKDLMLAELSDSPKVVHDGKKAIFIRSPDVSRANRAADVNLSSNPNFFQPVHLRLIAGVSQTVELNGQKYSLGFSQMGMIDRDPTLKQQRDYDVIFLEIRRAE